MIEPTEMDWIRAALLNAYHSGLTLVDLIEAAAHPETPQEFDAAVNILGLATPPVEAAE